MLIPCAVVLGAFLVLLGAGPDGVRWRDGASIAGAVLVSGCLLGLAWQAHVQARRLNARRRQAVREYSELKNHNERLARYLPEIVPPVTREAPLALQAPEEVFVTVAFLDLVGFAAMVASHSVSEVVDVLNDFMALTSRLTIRHGGVLGKFLGDGVLIYFPESAADRGKAGAAARVLGAAGCARLSLALDPELRNLSRAWRERGLGVQLAVRAGMASGYCALGDWGGQGRLDYTLIGTPVNLASRLQSLATPGCALLCGATAALIAQDPDLEGHLGEPLRQEVRGLGSVMMHELSASAKVRAIPLPVRSGRPDA
jgi:class 3 adenylate cyclase